MVSVTLGFLHKTVWRIYTENPPSCICVSVMRVMKSELVCEGYESTLYSHGEQEWINISWGKWWLSFWMVQEMMGLEARFWSGNPSSCESPWRIFSMLSSNELVLKRKVCILQFHQAFLVFPHIVTQGTHLFVIFLRKREETMKIVRAYPARFTLHRSSWQALWLCVFEKQQWPELAVWGLGLFEGSGLMTKELLKD